MKLAQVTRLMSVLVGVVAAPALGTRAWAQTTGGVVSGCDIAKKPLFDFGSVGSIDASAVSSTPSGSGRVRMFGMPTGYLTNPLGIDEDFGAASVGSDGPDNGGNDLAGFVVAMGAYNPFFDFRRPDDPRSLGYNKCHLQYQVVDLGPTYASVTVQALFPAGRDVDGVATGPTIFSPAFAWFHDLGGGTALQGYVGQNIHVNSRLSENMGTRIHYGLGIQTPVPELCPRGEEGLFFFIQAMGRYRYDNLGESRPAVWDVYPGIQYRVNDNCWFSVGASRRFLFTWCWQY